MYWAVLYILSGIAIYIVLELVGIEKTVNHLVRMGLMRRHNANTLRDDYRNGHKLKTIAFFNECLEVARFPFLFGSWQLVMRLLMKKKFV